MTPKDWLYVLACAAFWILLAWAANHLTGMDYHHTIAAFALLIAVKAEHLATRNG